MKQLVKQQKTVNVSFPCVHGIASGKLVTISCFQASELKGPLKVVAGIDDESARRIIGAARYAEADDRAAAGVIASFSNPLFGGESYGLALALADKIARYGSHEKWCEIYATGRIPPDGCGEIEKIKEFEKKLDLLISQGKSGSIFVFPSDNLTEDAERTKDKLAQLEGNGIRWLAVQALSELESIIWKPVEKKSPLSSGGLFFCRLGNKTKEWLSKKRNHGKYTIAIFFCIIGLMLFILLIKNPPGLNSKIENESVRGVLESAPVDGAPY